MLHQRQRKTDASRKIVAQGLEHYADSFELCLCQAINHMNKGEFEDALTLLSPHRDREAARPYLAHCQEALSGEGQKVRR